MEKRQDLDMGLTAQQNFAKFRRALRRQDQELFDVLFERARPHQEAAVQVANLEPMESLLISMLIEMLGEQKRLRARVEKLEKELQEKPE
jgi:hypothetical protein